jgi:hypothetical protein
MGKTIYSIDNELQICDSAYIRVLCGSPSDPTWAKYRRLAGVPKKAKRITLRQSFLLWTTANLYHNGERGLTRFKVASIANELLQVHPEVSDLMTTLAGGDGIEGRNLAQAISNLIGKEVSTRTLYRRGSALSLPKFQMNKRYSLEQVRRFAASFPERQPRRKRAPKKRQEKEAPEAKRA